MHSRWSTPIVTMILKRSSSTWSTMTSLWNRIRSVKSTETGSTVKAIDNNVNISSDIPVTPWTISAPLINKESLTEFWIRTALFRVSSQKLNMLGRQITRLPLPMAILQMKFSPKKAAKEIHSLLVQAQARIANLPKEQFNDPNKFVIQQAVIGNGPYLKRIDIKGRGRHGVIWRPHSFLRLQVAIPDADAVLRKRFKVHIHKENKPVMVRLNY